jgi:dipeptidyl aminopeptidase/acylaminoacyl peptidase
VIHHPIGFDARHSYPIVDHLYAGPQRPMVDHHFELNGDIHSRLDRALAQLGYIVISVDARGTPGRSKAFQDAVYRNWGRHEVADHVAVITQLAKRHPYMDLNRVGVWGHSWGGYFTIRALAQAPDLFRVGIASAPGADPYDLVLYEPYLDLPSRAKQAYDFASLYPDASRIKGKLLMLIGSRDPACYAGVLRMTDHLIRAGVDHELVVFPGGYHAYLDPKHERYFVSKLVKHLQTHLQGRLTRERTSS